MENRIANLETSLRVMKVALLAVSVILIGMLLLAATPKNAQDLIQAKTIQIVDDNNNVVGVLTSQTGCGRMYLKHARDNTPFIELKAGGVVNGVYGGEVFVRTTDGKTPVEIDAIEGTSQYGLVVLKNSMDNKCVRIGSDLIGAGSIDILSGATPSLNEVRVGQSGGGGSI